MKCGVSKSCMRAMSHQGRPVTFLKSPKHLIENLLFLPNHQVDEFNLLCSLSKGHKQECPHLSRTIQDASSFFCTSSLYIVVQQITKLTFRIILRFLSQGLDHFFQISKKKDIVGVSIPIPQQNLLA